MAEIKVLVRNRENAGKTARKAGFAAAVFLPLVSACGGAALHSGEPAERAETALADEGCRISGRVLEYEEGGRLIRRDNVLEVLECPIAIACPYDEVTILTGRALIMVYRNGEESTDGEISISLESSRTDMNEILRPGFVDWAQSPEMVYVLTLDGNLTLVPKNDMGETIPVYRMGFDARNADLQYSEGFEFIANNAGQIVVMMATPEGATRTVLELPQRLRERVDEEDFDFFHSNGRLYYGNPGGDRVEIVVGGPSVTDVRLGN